MIDKPLIRVTTFNTQDIHHHETNNTDHLPQEIPKNAIQWVHVNSTNNTEILKTIQKQYSLHPLLIEDISAKEQRAKHEEYEGYHFVVLKQLHPTPKHVKSSRISIIFGNKYVISLSEGTSEVIDEIHTRLDNPASHLRSENADYLAYKIIDSVVDTYFSVLQEITERAERLEEQLLGGAQEEHLFTLQLLKRQLLQIQRNAWPLREAIHGLQRSDSAIITKKTRLYLRDVEDHTIQIIEGVQSLRELTAGMLDIYLSSVSNKTNEVIRVLTIIATIFIPLTFITGVYGMNFEYMPELASPYGYWITWIIMITMGGFMVAYFHKKKWW